MTRLRYRRMAAAGSATLVTLVAVLGATGVLPTRGAPEAAFASPPRPSVGSPQSTPGEVSQDREADQATPTLPRHPDGESVPEVVSTKLPERSGEGRRIVFDMSDQRVWLVSSRDRVRRTYLVSGSLTDNLDAGRYEVYSKSMNATGVDDSGTMKYMVRFAQGSRAPIGFHDIPVLRGEKLQTVSQLGTPQSHGCVRQRRSDAQALWRFAPLATTVVVLA